jgi:RNA polymerase sigma-54 factor
MDGMDMRIDQSLALQQQTVISHRQIVAVRVLQLPSQELAAAIARERDSNPAFEAEEHESCHRCGGALERGSRACTVCGAVLATPSASGDAVDGTGGDTFGDFYGGQTLGGQFEDDGTDPMLRVASTLGRADGLLRMLCASIADDDADIAEYLVGSLDHHGFLAQEIVGDTAEALDAPEARVEWVLEALQRMDPPGIGARGPRECLLLQLRHLRDHGEARPLAEELVEAHLHALAFRHFREVAREVGETPRSVEAEWQFIRDHLHPFPTHGFDPDFGDLAEAAPHVRPDVIIRRSGEHFEAEVVERQRYELHVNREYLWARKNLAELGSNDADKLHIRGYVEQAQSFISALRQRWDTMQRVSDALIELQRAFLEQGQSALRPLTRADVAKRVSLHESTVSRATDGKFVLLPSGKSVPFDDFFDSSLPVKMALRELIAAESARRPWSDEQLARLLVRRGFSIARRTIAKYREEEGILPSRLRRSRPAAAAQAEVPQPAKALAFALAH